MQLRARAVGPLVPALVALAVLAPGAFAADADPPRCPNVPLPERLVASDAAFVGRLVSTRPVGGGTSYRFLVDQPVKGPVGREVEVVGTALVDSEGTPLARDVAVGVLASLDGATLTTDSCGLTDPGGLLASFDEPRGNAIKIAIGLVILLVVLTWAIARRRRGTRPTLPRPS